MLSDEKRAALIQMCHDAGVMVLLDSKFGRSEYTSVQSSWPALEKLSVAVAEAAVKDAVGVRDRDADRQKFSDPAFNRWLDESITENGEFSVWHQLGDVATAWSAWESRPHYERKACDLCDCTGDIHDQTGEWRGECPYCRPQASAAVPEDWREVMQGLVECARDEIVRCEGMKCREPNCISCNDELEATTSVERSREFVFRARAMLAASQPEVK